MACRLCLNNRRYSLRQGALLIAKGDRYQTQPPSAAQSSWRADFLLLDAGLTLTFRSPEALTQLATALLAFAAQLETHRLFGGGEDDLPF